MNPTLPPPRELLGDPLYSRLKEYLIQSTGLVYYTDKDADLARRIGRRLSGFGFHNCAPYLELLHDPHRGPSEMDALIAEVTIGESYFFRHAEHFDALRELVLPDLIDRNARHRRLRIWCAGCADGAEPYSLSILLRRELAHLLPGWQVSILGTDINRQYLTIAREGRYEEWSLRATSNELRRACFEQEGKRWTIAPEYKTGVSFQFHNLVENPFPPQLDDLSAFDLIICRNVMIYFGSELMQRLVRQFHDCLAPGSWLLVGPSEPNMTCFTAFRPVNAPGVTLYQKPAGPATNVAETFTFPSLRLPVVPLEQIAEAPPAIPSKDATVPTLDDLRQRAKPRRLGKRRPLRQGIDRVRQPQCPGSLSLCFGPGAHGRHRRIGAFSSKGHLSRPASGSDALSFGTSSAVARRRASGDAVFRERSEPIGIPARRGGLDGRRWDYGRRIEKTRTNAG